MGEISCPINNRQLNHAGLLPYCPKQAPRLWDVAAQAVGAGIEKVFV